MPKSADLLIKKSNVIYRDPEPASLISSQSKPEIGVQSISSDPTEQNKPISLAEKLLQEMSNKVSVPLLFPLIPIRTRGISQSIDSISMPSLSRVEKPDSRLKGIFESVKVKAKALHENIMNNLRSQDRQSIEI